ncbi:MAG: PAS domain-containing sensor histidine kinase [Sulfuricurvum sp.]|nr:PAS domain-containing sensor histidine kinase [Sulfuricurvum sp.]
MAKFPSAVKDTQALRAKAEEMVSAYEQKNSKTLSIEETSILLHELQVHQIELEMQNDELQTTQHKLHAEQKRYFDLYNLAPVGYCTLSEEGVVIESNLTAANLLGVSRNKLIGQSISAFIHSGDQDAYYLYRKKILKSSESQSCELRMIKDSVPFWTYWVSQIDHFSDGKPVVKAVISDISDRKKIELELKQTEEILIVQSKLAAMGEMVGMIAHQWRQPLNIVALAIMDIETKNLLQTLSQSEFDNNIDIVTKNIRYMSETIDDFRNYFKPDLSKESVTIGDVLNNALDIVGERLARHNIALTVQNNAQKNLLIHKNQLTQVLLNIIGNAVDALISNKTPSPVIDIGIDETQDTVTIRICDNAGGIPEIIMDKISEPYFTTKELNGTGLGLYISRTIIEKYLSGYLLWYNEINGACFAITLKAVHEE